MAISDQKGYVSMPDASHEQDLWIQAVHEFEPVSWERLPELDLYMDQVITLMGKQLALFQSEEDKLLTPSMINNYVKGGVLPRPVQKKYSREHLAKLQMICLLKSILSLPEIQQTIQGLENGQEIPELYAEFSSVQKKAMEDVARRLEQLEQPSSRDLYQTAMALALEASARRTAAARILSQLKAAEEEAKKVRKDKEKSSKDERDEKEAKKEESSEPGSVSAPDA